MSHRSARNARPDPLVALLARIVQAIAEREALAERGKMQPGERPQEGAQAR